MTDDKRVNGYNHQLDKIEKDVGDIKDGLETSINGLTKSVDNLSTRIDSWIRVAETSVPIKAVYYLIGTMILGLLGVEGVKAVAPVLKHYFGGL